MSPSPSRTERVISIGSAVVFACAVALHFYLVMRAQGDTDDALRVAQATGLGATVALVAALPPGLLLRSLPHRFGRAGLAVASAAVVVALVVLFASAHALTVALAGMDDVGFVLTGRLWEEAGWAGTVLYLVTIPIDIILMMGSAILAGVAPFVLPPAAGLCCELGWVLLALPFLHLARRRRQPRLPG